MSHTEPHPGLACTAPVSPTPKPMYGGLQMLTAFHSAVSILRQTFQTAFQAVVVLGFVANVTTIVCPLCCQLHCLMPSRLRSRVQFPSHNQQEKQG